MIDLIKWLKKNATYSFKVWYLIINEYTKEESCIFIIQSKIRLSEFTTLYIDTHFLILKEEETYSLHELNFD